jgi:hypothetical protein
LEDLGIDGRIILKFISGKQGWRLWIEFIWLTIGTVGGLVDTIMNLRVA